MDLEVISPETEESVTQVEEAVLKEAGEGALLVGMDSIDAKSLTRTTQAEEVAGKRSDKVEEVWQMEWPVEEEISQIERHIALLGIVEKLAKKEAALLAGMIYSADGESLMRKQAEEEESGNKCEMLGQAEKDMMIYFSSLPTERGGRAMEQYYAMKYEAAEWKALVAKAEKRKALLASQEKSARREKAKAKAKVKAKARANEEARKAEASVTEAGRPEESVTEAEKAEEAVEEKEDYFPKGVQIALLDIKEKWAKKKNDRETLRQLVKDLSDKFHISMKSTPAIEEHAPMVESNKLLLQPADPSATNSMARLGVQDDLHDDRGKSSAATEAKNFDMYRSSWESSWGKTFGSFEHMTALSSMQFTYCTPGCNRRDGAASTPATLQIFSIKLAEIAGGLGWPLSVYGVVAVRDVVDHNRNFLFSCGRDNSQELTQNDPFLRLIGPSRAVVLTDRVHFEIQLKVKGTTKCEDEALITEGCSYNEPCGDGLSTVCFKNCFCKIELCVQVVRTTTQATILGVQAARGGQWPFEYGARVTCSALPGKWGVTDDRITCVTYPASGEIVMVDSKDGAMLEGCDGYLHLPRNVISVEAQGRLDVEIQAYSKSGEIAARQHVRFQPKFSKISQMKCSIRGAELVITVAWSLVASDKRIFMVLGRSACGSC